jgi:hypothetical protein
MTDPIQGIVARRKDHCSAQNAAPEVGWWKW